MGCGIGVLVGVGPVGVGVGVTVGVQVTVAVGVSVNVFVMVAVNSSVSVGVAVSPDPAVRRQIRSDAVCDYFKYQYVPDPKTIFHNIHKLEPGHFLLCNRAGWKKKPYWDISFRGKGNGSLEEAAARWQRNRENE